MSAKFSPSIVRDGLAFHVDAANSNSVVSNEWIDLISGGTVTKTGTPSLTTLGGATTWRFTATNQFFENSFAKVTPYKELTIEAWIYPETDVSSGDRGTIVKIHGQGAYMSYNKSTNKLSSYWYGTNPEGYHEFGSAMTRNSSWYHLCSVWAHNNLYQYQNMTVTSGSVGGENYLTGTNVEIGMESTDRQFAGGIAVVRIYNRALAQNEVQQNFNAERKRFQ